MKKSKEKNIILFDGVCNLCNNSINYIIKNDKKKAFLYANLQSKFGKNILEKFKLSTQEFDSILVYTIDGRLLNKSTAILNVFKKLKGINPILYGFIIIPRPIRDYVYGVISKNRYKWFGKSEQCQIPTKEIKELFVD